MRGTYIPDAEVEDCDEVQGSPVECNGLLVEREVEFLLETQVPELEKAKSSLRSEVVLSGIWPVKLRIGMVPDGDGGWGKAR